MSTIEQQNIDLNRTLAAYFKLCGERCGNEGVSNEGFRRFETPASVWVPIRWGLRSSVIDAAWFLTNPEDSEYGLCASWADRNLENIFGYKDKNGKQIIAGERSYITFYTSIDGSRSRFEDKYDFFTPKDNPKLGWIQTKLRMPDYKGEIVNFPIPESPDRESWLKRSFPKEDQWQWLQENQPQADPYEEVDKVLAELSRLFPLLYPPFADFKRLYQVMEGNKDGK